MARLGFKWYVVGKSISTFAMAITLLTIVFLILRVIPGDPARVLLPEDADEETVQRLREDLGLNLPIHIQYFDFMSNIFRGDLYRSFEDYEVNSKDQQNATRGHIQFGVSRRILQSFPATVELVVAGMLVGVFFGVLFGVVSALKRNTWIDHVIRFFTTSGYALPLIWTGLLAQQVAGLYWGILPISGRVTTITLEPARITGLFVLDSLITGNIPSLLSSLEHLILPSLVMGLYTIAVISRITRGETLRALSQDFILTARAKGLKERAVVLKHAFKNALLPVITISGMQFAAMLSGVVVTETIFNVHGLGQLFILSLEQRDYPTIQGIMVFAALITSAASLIIDLIYYKIDPRVKL